MNCCKEGNSSTIAELMNPINYMNPYVAGIHISFGLIGIPMNFLVAGTIIFTKQLRALQNIAWLGVSFSNVFLLSSYLVEIGAAQEENPYIFLPLHRGTLGLPIVCIILNLHLSLLERRIFFNYATFHEKYVTSGSILAIQLICFVLISLLLKGPLFFQSLSLSFKHIINELDVAVILTSLFIGFITLYIPCKKCSEDNMDHSYSILNNNTPEKSGQQADSIENDQVGTNSSGFSPENRQQNPEKCSEHENNKSGSTFHDDINPSFSLLELQGYQSIKINLKIFFIFATVTLLLLCFSIFCIIVSNFNECSINCCSICFRTTYLIRVILFGSYTSLFNPLCFVGHSHDFFILRLRCNPIGGIARATRGLIYRFNKPVTHVVANV